MSSKEYYSRLDVAEEYDDERFSTVGGRMFDSLEKDVVTSALCRPKRATRALDAGAGSGRFTILLAEKGLDVVACDYSDAMLDIIRNKVKNRGFDDCVEIRKEDITHLSFDDNEFDFVCCMRVLVNLDTEDNIAGALKELTRVCKPGGIIVLDFVNPLSFAALGPMKSSMITLANARRCIDSISEARVVRSFGRRIVSQSLFEKAPRILLGIVDTWDKALSTVLPMFCVRLYFILEKEGGQ